jgi:hypothetical protein
MWPVVNQCLNDTSSPGQPVCKYKLVPCSEPTDPNSLQGPLGVAAQRWVAGQQALTYVVSFSNEPTALVPAQQVVVTQPLGANVSLSSLSLPFITLPNRNSRVQITIPPNLFNPTVGLNEYATNVDLRPSQALFVNVDAKLDPPTQTLTWTLTSIDPSTGLPPVNPLVGFLPPGTGANVSFSVKPTPGLATGSPVSEQATIVFLGSSPTSTKTWSNTVDNTPPTSKVNALPAHACLDFNVSWSGTDVGSGIQDYTVYVSDTGGPFEPWLTNTPALSATYQGQSGHWYRFYSIARDRTGNMEGAKTSAEAATSIATTTTCGGPPNLTSTARIQSVSGTTWTVALQITNNGTEVADNIVMTKVVPRVLSGAGTLTYTNPVLPVSIGNLAPGASTTVNLVLSVPATASTLGIVEAGTMQDARGKTYSYTLGQEMVP